MDCIELSDDELEVWEERYAIALYDGGCSEDVAREVADCSVRKLRKRLLHGIIVE